MPENKLELLWHDGHQRESGLMVVLHGFAEHPTAALQLGAMIDTEYRYRICAPHGPIKVAASKYAFYRSVSRMNPDPEDFNGARFAIHDAVEADIGELINVPTHVASGIDAQNASDNRAVSGRIDNIALP